MSNVVKLIQPSLTPPADVGKGFTLFHRKIMDCGFYKDSQAVHLWFHLIMKASHKSIVASTEFGDMAIGRGQLITGRNKLVAETGIVADRIQYLLKKFIRMEMIRTESNKKFTLITIVNYDEYQADFVPTDSQQIPNAKPRSVRVAEVVVPTDSQQIPTYKEVTNNLLPNGNKSPSASAEDQSAQDDKPASQEQKKPALSCQEVLDVYHEVLPEAKGVRLLSDKRRNQIRTFWKKASKITRGLDGEAFTLDSWRAYLQYIAENCRWMLEDRQDQRSGKVWHRKGLEYFLSDEVYLQVREGAKDDR